MSYGIDHAAGLLVAYLPTAVPDALVALGATVVVDNPRLYSPAGRPIGTLEAGMWPAVMVDRLRLLERRVIDEAPSVWGAPGTVSPGVPTASRPVWENVYQMRVLVYARGDRNGFDATATAASQLLAAVRLAFDWDATLGSPDSYVEVGSFTEAYSDVTPIADSRTMAGAYLQLRQHVFEQTPQKPAPNGDAVAVAESIDLTVTRMA